MNKKSDTPEVLYSDDKAAKYMTKIKGWIDRHGRYWGEGEQMARWSGCTHVLCEGCGQPTRKHYVLCSKCREKAAMERHKQRKTGEWDGKTPIYSDYLNKYFMDEFELSDFLEEYEGTVESLMLLICDPVYPKHIEAEYFSDGLFDDDVDLPQELISALNEFNEKIDKMDIIIVWLPGDIAVLLEAKR